VISGAESRDKPGNAVIRTSRYSMINNYKLFINNCDFQDLDINHSFEVLQVYKNTFADSIVLRNSTFQKVSGSVLALDKETDDIGIYNAENVIIENCRFEDIGFAVLDLHRGGRDESTFGPMLKIDECTFEDVGHDQRNKTGASITLHGVQIALIQDSRFIDSEPIKLHMVVGEPITRVVDCTFENTPEIQANDEPYHTENLTYR
jgi:poly(beta-D-mannuronate) lyase